MERTLLLGNLGGRWAADKWSSRANVRLINTFYAGWDIIREAGQRPVQAHVSGMWRWCWVWWLWWLWQQWHSRGCHVLLSLGQVDLFDLCSKNNKKSHTFLKLVTTLLTFEFTTNQECCHHKILIHQLWKVIVGVYDQIYGIQTLVTISATTQVCCLRLKSLTLLTPKRI